MLEKTYNPADVEETLYDEWEQSGSFAADTDSNKAPYNDNDATAQRDGASSISATL